MLQGVALAPLVCYYGDPFCHPTIIILSMTFCCLLMSLLLGENTFFRDEDLFEDLACMSCRRGLNP